MISSVLRIRIPDFYLTGSGSDFSKGADLDRTKYVEVSKLSQIVATFAKENLINFIKKIYFQVIFIQLLLNVTIIPVFTLFTIGDVVVKI